MYKQTNSKLLDDVLKTEDILNELGINQQMEYSWGKISSDYDARSNVSSIDIMYF